MRLDGDWRDPLLREDMRHYVEESSIEWSLYFSDKEKSKIMSVIFEVILISYTHKFAIIHLLLEFGFILSMQIGFG